MTAADMARAQALHRAVDDAAYRLALAVQGEAEDGRVKLTPRLLSGAVQTQASNAGRLLSYMSRTPEIKAALAEAEDERNGQNKLPFDGDGKVIPFSAKGGTAS